MKGIKILCIATALAALPMHAWAQDKVEVSVGADLVSNYIWRGQDLGGVSIQPGATVSYQGFSLGAWGSASFDGDGGNTKELDLTLAYSNGGFTIGVTDYWFGGDDYFHYGAHSTTHVFEANVGYDFGVVALNWYTNFAGNDGINSNGKRAYSSYINADVPFKLGDLDWTFSVGAVPFKTSFYNGWTNGFEVSDLSLGVSKELKISDSISIPVFAKTTWNPATESAYFAFGISL